MGGSVGVGEGIPAGFHGCFGALVLLFKPTLSPPIRVFVPHTWCDKGKLQLSSLADRPARQVFSWYSKAPTLFAFFFRLSWCMYDRPPPSAAPPPFPIKKAENKPGHLGPSGPFRPLKGGILGPLGSSSSQHRRTPEQGPSFGGQTFGI